MQIYKESRTLIIEKYRESTKQRLEFPAVKEAVARSGISTDYEGLRRIYDFLDAWGLINYEASDGAGHSWDSLPPAVAASGAPLPPTCQRACQCSPQAGRSCHLSVDTLPAWVVSRQGMASCSVEGAEMEGEGLPAQGCPEL